MLFFMQLWVLKVRKILSDVELLLKHSFVKFLKFHAWSSYCLFLASASSLTLQRDIL